MKAKKNACLTGKNNPSSALSEVDFRNPQLGEPRMRHLILGCFAVVLSVFPAFAQTMFVLPEEVPPPKATQERANATKDAAAGGSGEVSADGSTDGPVTQDMIPMPTVRLRTGLVDMPDVRGVPLELPQSFSVLRHRKADELPPASPTENDAAQKTETAQAAPTLSHERSEHLSTLEETTAYDAPAWTTEVALPHAGVYQFIVETKPAWTPVDNRFVQHTAKALHSGQGSTIYWDQSAGLDFEIIPLSRPFELCVGMSFSGQVLRAGKPLAGAFVEAAWLPPDNAAQRKRAGKPPYTPMQEIRTTDNGVFTLTLPWAGWWGFSAVVQGGDPLRDPSGQMKPVDRKTTLWVKAETCSPR